MSGRARGGGRWLLVIAILLFAAFAIATWSQNYTAHQEITRHERESTEALTLGLIASCERANVMRREISLPTINCEKVVRMQVEQIDKDVND